MRTELFLVFVLFPISSAVSSNAQSLQIHPKRIVFEGDVRTQEIHLTNRGSNTTTVRLSWQRLSMKPNGGFASVPPGEDGMFSDPLVRFFPRQVALPPGEKQVVRLLLRKPADLAMGEYRSHLAFTPLPDGNAGLDAESLGREDSALGTRLTAVVSVTMPVIVRHGRLEAAARIDRLQLDTTHDPVLSMVLSREGETSVYGDLVATLTDRDGHQTVIGRMKGLAIYTNLDSRHLSMKLRVPDNLDLAAGTLTVALEEPAALGGKSLAVTSLER